MAISKSGLTVSLVALLLLGIYFLSVSDTHLEMKFQKKEVVETEINPCEGN